MLRPLLVRRLAVENERGDRKYRFGDLADNGDRVEAAAHVEHFNVPLLGGKQREDRLHKIRWVLTTLYE